MKKILIILLFTAFLLTLEAKELPKENYRTQQYVPNISIIVNKYITTISKSSNIKIVGLSECDDYQARIDDYFNDIFKYHIGRISFYQGMLNDDNSEDYLVSYVAFNCWNGNGAQNYLSNFFIITSNNNKRYSVNEQLTKKFKRVLLDALNKKHGKTSYKKVEKTKYVNGVDFDVIGYRSISGSYNITTDECDSGQPCFKGYFEYDIDGDSIRLY